MDEVAVPHVWENIFSRLDHQSLMNCRKVSRSWDASVVQVKRSSHLTTIKYYTKCSDELLEAILAKCGAPIILVSILENIFRNFPKGTKQNKSFLKRWGNTPLHIAAANGQLAAYRLIMDNVEDKNIMATFLGSIEILGFRPNQLEKTNIDINNRVAITTYTPLHLAAINGHVSTCKLIMDNVIEKNPPNPLLFTPLHCAAISGNMSLFQMIIETIHGDKNPRDNTGCTPLHMAAAYGHFEICSLILSYDEIAKCFENLKDCETHCETPFHLAAANGHLQIYKLLLERNIRGQKKTNTKGKLPIHHAAKYGHLEICKLILENAERKEDCNVKDNLGNSPLDFAKLNSHSEIMRVFTDARIDETALKIVRSPVCE